MDNIDILERTQVKTKQPLTRIEEAVKEVGLIINECKTKITTQTRTNAPVRRNLAAGEFEFENISHLRILGQICQGLEIKL